MVTTCTVFYGNKVQRKGLNNVVTVHSMLCSKPFDPIESSTVAQHSCSNFYNTVV